jgi:hypothetical protein
MKERRPGVKQEALVSTLFEAIDGPFVYQGF